MTERFLLVAEETCAVNGDSMRGRSDRARPANMAGMGRGRTKPVGGEVRRSFRQGRRLLESIWADMEFMDAMVVPGGGARRCYSDPTWIEAREEGNEALGLTGMLVAASRRPPIRPI